MIKVLMCSALILSFFFCLILISCKVDRQKDCIYTSNKLLQYNGNKIFGTNVVDGHIVEFRDIGKDSIRGGYYTFFNNGNLKSYQYFFDMKTYIYSEEYDSLGKLNKIEGNPIVKNLVRSTTNDSLFITVYFFALNKLYDFVKVKTSDNKLYLLQPIDDTLYSNMKVVSFYCRNTIKESKKLVCYIMTKYKDSCSSTVTSVKDSLVLYYKP